MKDQDSADLFFVWISIASKQGVVTVISVCPSPRQMRRYRHDPSPIDTSDHETRGQGLWTLISGRIDRSPAKLVNALRRLQGKQITLQVEKAGWVEWHATRAG